MVFNYGDWKEISGDDESLLFQRKVLKEGVNKKNLNEVAGVNLLETKTLSCWEEKIFFNKTEKIYDAKTLEHENQFSEEVKRFDDKLRVSATL